MPYEPNVLRMATRRLEEQRTARRREQREQRERLYAAAPRLKEIEARLRRTVAEVASAALKRGEDPGPRIRVLKESNLELQQEKRRLLMGLGYPEDALDETPLCPRCGDSGWVGAEMCRCLQTLCAREQVKALSAVLPLGDASFETFRLDYYGEEPWPQTGQSPRENMEFVYEVATEYARKFPAFPFRSLLFSGGTGLGKTFLSACIARTVAGKGFSVVYDTAVRVFSAFEEQKFHFAAEAEQDMRRYRGCDLLILDDLGSELTTSFVQSVLYTLVNDRLVAGKHTIISTNLGTQELRQRYSPQIASRLLGEYQTLLFFGDDIRILKKQGDA